MEETADKGLEVKAIRKSRVIGRIFVTGYDTSLARKHVMRVLKKLFSSCGKITDVYLPMSNSDIKSIWGRSRQGLASCDLMELTWEDGLSVLRIIRFFQMMAGTKFFILEISIFKMYHFLQSNYRSFAGFAVEGYDTSLSVSDIKCQFGKLFSSCGKIVEANIYKSSCSSMVFVEGEDIEETAPKLTGTEIGGRKVVVQLVTRPTKSTFHPRRLRGRMGRGAVGRGAVYDRPPDKKAKMTLE